jgi:hypothetical protein
MKVYKYSEYSLNSSMAQDLLDSLLPFLKEEVKGEIPNYKKIEEKIIRDLKLNASLIMTFGVGIGAFYPIVEKLMNNMNISSIEMTLDKVVLLTIAAISIIYLEEKKSKNEDKLRKDCKSMLEELKMMGIGNGIVKKLIEAFKSIKNVFSIIIKHFGAVVGGFMDMFSYTGLLIPVMNGIMYIIDKYHLTIDTMIQNFIGVGISVGTIIAKHGIIDIIDRLRDRFPINKKKIISEIETPIVQKIGDIRFGDSEVNQDGDLIKEQ